MYMAGSASEQNEANPAGKELHAFFFQKKNNPPQSHSCGTTKMIFFTVSGDGPISLSRFKPPFRVRLTIFSLTAAVVPNNVVQ